MIQIQHTQAIGKIVLNNLKRGFFRLVFLTRPRSPHRIATELSPIPSRHQHPSYHFKYLITDYGKCLNVIYELNLQTKR
jgi:hypothetical protein